MRSLFCIVLCSSLICLSLAKAQSPGSIRSAIHFHELLRRELPPAMQDNESLSMVHMVPNQQVSEIPRATSLRTAMDHVKSVRLADLIANNRVTPTIASEAPSRRGPITLVLIPGLFSEFITGRIFDEVLSRPSRMQQEYKQTIAEKYKAGNPDAADNFYDELTRSRVEVPLSRVVQVGVLTDQSGAVVAKLVHLNAMLGSAESFGELGANAEILNRRLGKYLKISGDENIALLGYSQGAAVALQMLSSAKRQGLPFVRNTVAMVSWAGLLWGTEFSNQTQLTGGLPAKTFQQIKKLRSGLDANSEQKSAAAWQTFAIEMKKIADESMLGRTYPDVSTIVDPPALASLGVMPLWLSIEAWAQDPAMLRQSVDIFQRRLDQLMIGLVQMTDYSRARWWRQNILPGHITYYSLDAATADPSRGRLDREAWEGNWGYGQNSYDDQWMLQNHIDTVATNGVFLNDGQVSAPQSMFLTVLMRALNPSNAAVKTVHLGSCGTHHWGMAYRTVNALKTPRINPFPREALLRALIEKIRLDSEP